MIKERTGWLRAYHRRTVQEKIDGKTLRWRVCDSYQLCLAKHCPHHSPHLKCNEPRHRTCVGQDVKTGCRRVSKLERLMSAI